MTTYNQLIKEAEKKLAPIDANFQARLLMLELTREQDIDLYLVEDTPISDALAQQYKQGVERLLKHEPLAYILGYSWFYGRKFKVDQRVLIPRNETEELVAYVLADIDEYFSNQETIDIIDVGTGSGAIAVSIKAEIPQARVVASDISQDALDVAQINATYNNTEIQFLCGDMLQPFIQQEIKADILICNPPYIKAEETVEPSVVDYEPHIALFGGSDGLRYYRQVFTDAAKVLKDKAMLAFEIGYDQKEAMLALAQSYFPLAKMDVIKDINGQDRIFVLYHQFD